MANLRRKQIYSLQYKGFGIDIQKKDMPKESAEAMQHKAQGARRKEKLYAFGLEPCALCLFFVSQTFFLS